MRSSTTRHISEAMPYLWANARRRAIEPSHGRLHRNVRRLIQGSENDGRQPPIYFFVHDVKWQRRPLPHTFFRQTPVLESPSVFVEHDLRIARAAERAVYQYLVSTPDLGSPEICARDLIVSRARPLLDYAVGTARIAHEESQREHFPWESFLASHQFGRRENVRESLSLLE